MNKKSTKILIGIGLLVLFLLAGIGIGTIISGGNRNSDDKASGEKKTVSADASGSNSETEDKNTQSADKNKEGNADDALNAAKESEDTEIVDAGGLPVGENPEDRTEGEDSAGDVDSGKDSKNENSDKISDDKSSGNTELTDIDSGKKNTDDKNSDDKNSSDKNLDDKNLDDKNLDDKNSDDKNLDDKNSGDKNSDDKNLDDKNLNDKNEDNKNPDDKASDDKDSSGKGSKDGSDKDTYTLTVSNDNSWVNGGVTMYGLQFGITNETSKTISGWNLVINIEGLSTVEGWNGTFSIDGDKLKVENVSYNADIYANGQIVIGCNLGTTAGKLNIKSATINGKPMTVVGGKVDQNKQNNNPGGNSGNGNNSGNGGNTGGNDKITDNVNVSELLKRCDNAKQGDDWLHTDGRRILDKDGKQVWLTGLNWFGYNTGTNTFDGLWNSKLVPTVKAIADHGFNLIRVPISAELINQWSEGEYPKANYNNALNPEMNSMNSLQIWEYFLSLAEANGIKVMPDIHSAETNASGHNVNLWYTDKVKVNDYYHALEWMADRYKNNDTIIAYDLKNEPHGKPYEGKNAAIWNDSKSANNWKYVAETAAAKILAKNQNVLILVEGIEIYPTDLKTNSDYHSTNDKDYYFNWWGGNLRAVKDYPIDLGKYQDKLVYSPHDYGPTVYAQPWFDKDYDFNSLMKDCWKDNWFYIYEDDIAPLLIGEWGGYMTKPNITWMTYMRKLIKDNHLNHTFWCLNANSGDTGGLLLDDFTTWDTEKYNFVKEVLWQEKGKFVGLDHEIPLGDNGITCSKASGLK